MTGSRRKRKGEGFYVMDGDDVNLVEGDRVTTVATGLPPEPPEPMDIVAEAKRIGVECDKLTSMAIAGFDPHDLAVGAFAVTRSVTLVLVEVAQRLGAVTEYAEELEWKLGVAVKELDDAIEHARVRQGP